MWNRVSAAIVLVSLASSTMPAAVVSMRAMRPTVLSGVAHEHSCCPGVPARIPIAIVNVAPNSMPCSGQHPCCAGREHERLPSLPVLNQSTTGSECGVAAFEETAAAAQSVGVRHYPLFDSAPVRSTVLRI